MAMISININEELKKEAEELCEELGLDMTTAITIFLRKMCREQRIPFDVSLYSQELRDAIDNVDNGINMSRQFDTVHELIEDLTND